MLSFFRINDPFRLVAILGIVLLMSTIYIWIVDIPLLQPEMIWMLLGERMADGKHMYIDIIDDTGPLSAGVFWVVHLVFGKSALAYKFIAAFIVLFQVVYVNYLFIRYKSFEDNTYIPAFVMTVLFYISFDLVTLSPALMGSTFIVLALGQLFSQTVLQKEGSDAVLLVGIFGGIAACFHFPLATFLPFLLVSGIIVSGFSFQQIIVSLIAYAMPLVFCALYFFWIDGFEAFIYEFIIAPRLIESYAHVSYRDLALLFALPMFFSVLGFFVGFIVKSQTVNQQKQLQLNLIFLIFAVSSLLLTNRRTPYQFIVMLPALTYFISLLLVVYKKGITIQVLTAAFVFGIPIIGIVWTLYQINSGIINSYAINFEEKHTIAKSNKILVLGEDLGYYQGATLATPYLHFRLSKNVIEDQRDLANTVKLYDNFLIERPEIIIDEEGVFAKLLERIPILAKEYEKRGTSYFLKKTN
ncbi:hypothetical protein M3O96_07285 [Aquiflexum sp. TKW24L]|uniref:hypothetical protein n=1 Tax=Aquiflexum sp. TKW24L TaxID=2942212 RepID=UPI0020BDC698|nr:hypothetical protein [Aquiflexum sp. TKW24L]MCL6258882.1 hypothetical protein [Aquiflexum sp. TKW24L]